MKLNLKERLQSLKMVADGWRPQAIDLNALKTLPAGKETHDIVMVRANSACRASTWPKTAPPAAGVAPGAEVERELSLEF